MKLIPSALAAACLALPSAAGASETLLGRFALEQKWEDSAKPACKTIDAALAQRLASPKIHCPSQPTTGTASGRPAIVCTGEKLEILVFRAKTDCEQEIKANKGNND